MRSITQMLDFYSFNIVKLFIVTLMIFGLNQANTQCTVSQFQEAFDLSNWVIDLQGGIVDVSGAPSQVVITGSSETGGVSGGAPDRFTTVCITIPKTGTIGFSASAFMAPGAGGQFNNDQGSYLLDGVRTFIASGTGNTLPPTSFGPIAVTMGQQFCFEVASNRYSNRTVMAISNFEYNTTNPTVLWNAGTLEENNTYPNGDRTANVCVNGIGRYIIATGSLDGVADYVYDWSIVGGVAGVDYNKLRPNPNPTNSGTLDPYRARYQFITPGTYTVNVVVTDGLGCTGSNSYDVTVRENPEVSIETEVNYMVCPNTDLPITTVASGGSEPYKYVWSELIVENPSEFLDPINTSDVVFNGNAGEYSLIVSLEDSYGCADTDTLRFLVGDTIAPVINCPSNIELSTSDTSCLGLVNYGIQVDDNCWGPLIFGFYGDMDISYWYQKISETGNGMFITEDVPYQVLLSGSNDTDNPGANQSSMCFTNNIGSGQLSFLWDYTTSDLDLADDVFGIEVNGIFLGLSSGIGDENDIHSLTLDVGDEFCFVINTNTNSGGNAQVVLSNLGFNGGGIVLHTASGPEPGEIFPVGLYNVELRFVDVFENVSEVCSFTINIEDNTAPTIVCPENVTLNLAPLACDTVYEYESLIVVSDNCPDPFYNLVSGLSSGSVFDLGVHEISLEAEDTNGNLSGECTFTVTVSEYNNNSLGCKPINVSLDEFCFSTLTPTEVLTGWQGTEGAILLGCEALYEINVLGKNGEQLGPELTKDMVGKSFMYVISHPNGFTCMNTVLVEDKFPPTIDCSNAVIHCLEDPTNVALPIVSDACGASYMLVSQVSEMLPCDEEYVGKLTRRWKAVDYFGNESEVCISEINLLRPTNPGITAPTTNVTLKCSDNFARDDKGSNNPAPSVTGVPSFNGRPLFPSAELDMILCNSFIDYEDQILLDSECKKIIRRTWKITEWHCSTLNELFIGIQMISILDDTPPTIVVPQDFTVSTGPRSCDANINIPAATITDNCQADIQVYINAVNLATSVPTGFVNGNGGSLRLPVGTHSITYTAIDKCKNVNTASFNVSVFDQTDPVAICDQHLVVSIKTDGSAILTASALDNGSFDECGPVTIAIQRVDDICNNGFDIEWHDQVSFCCLDANTTPMVALLVTDESQNTNQCMVSVKVQEKVNPTISCPNDTTITNCEFTFDPSFAGANAAFGSAVIFDNCPANNEIDHVLVDNRNNCGIGEVIRNFVVRDGQVQYGACTQTITFVNDAPFDGSTIIWPADYNAIGQCSPLGLEPDALPFENGFPRYEEGLCDMVGMGKEDLIFPFTTNGACYKIIRKWTVIDWCQVNSSDTYTWTYEQEIKVIDNDNPVISVPTTTQIFETLNCTSGVVTLGATATDCTPADELRWRYWITQNALPFSDGNGNVVSRTFDVGQYNIRFQVEDRCGNLSEANYDFEVVSKKPANPICKKGLSTSLTLMDGVPLVMIEAEFFDNDSYHSCMVPFTFSFSPDVDDVMRTFTCDSIGLRQVNIYLTDVFGNQSFCETNILIEDTENLCGPGTTPIIAGTISNEQGKMIEDVQVELLGSELPPFITEEDGSYMFDSAAKGGTYTIIPTKNDDPLNGISTMDLILIQRHILGVEKLDSPYKLIAADVNGSKNISASDLNELRKLILKISDQFPNNENWKFIDANKKFIDANMPWAGDYSENYFIEQLSSDMVVDFIGIKVGDVNNSAQVNTLGGNSLESRSMSKLHMVNMSMVANTYIDIPVYADNYVLLHGFQLSMDVRKMHIDKLMPGLINIKSSDYVINDAGQLRISISLPYGSTFSSEDVLFYIRAKSTTNSQLSELIALNDEIRPEIYLYGMEVNNLGIHWRNIYDLPFALKTINPNPWINNTNVEFYIPSSGNVTLVVRDYMGRLVHTHTKFFEKGDQQFLIQREDINASGVYLYDLKFEDKTQSGKMIMID